MRAEWSRRWAIFLLILVGLAIFVVRGAASGAGEGPVVGFSHADYSFSGSRTIPADGWQRGPVPDFTLLRRAAPGAAEPVAWVRFRFDRRAAGPLPIALYVEMIRDNLTVLVNGVELYRTRAEKDDPTLAWNHPLFVPLPEAMLRPGANELAFRIETTTPQLLGIGNVRVGADRPIRSMYNNETFLSTIAPQIVSGYLLIVTIGAMTFWVRRPADRSYGWLFALGLVWLFRNLHYFVQDPPFEPAAFWIMTTDSLFVLLAVAFGFAACVFELPQARRIQLQLGGFALVAIAFRHVLVALHASELPSFALAFPVSAAMILLMLRACRRDPSAAKWTMFAAITLAIAFAFHDMVFTFNLTGGASFYLLPYGGLLIFAAFDATLTHRLQNALIDVEDVNLTLEARVAEARASLVDSEAARAELRIAHAVDLERERIMRDIHDGIGSSLLTALVNARHRDESPETIATLSRSLADLRIGVDSLEPTGGDVVALLANLRHRMERELKGAGMTFVWKVEAAPVLPWLDPIGALHILRILQEAIGNALNHSDAAQIEVRCAARDHEGAAGVCIEIVDRGKGFDPAGVSRGKGLANMAARAEALNGAFRCDSVPGAGTVSAIWLPIAQARVGR
ncbi:hypothetical protein U1839_08685 [Sphingomonas sp. RT2P30]|uniref:sensor histidine kinase n=1 Tax=Parasphingomonas halimpatiens TaxID=3096162 RepID=UPI002FCC3CCD